MDTITKEREKQLKIKWCIELQDKLIKELKETYTEDHFMANRSSIEKDAYRRAIFVCDSLIDDYIDIDCEE